MEDYREEIQNESRYGEYEGNPFLIMEGWSIIEKVQAATRKDFDDIVKELFGAEWGFSDEYSVCDGCYKVIRTQPSHWGDFGRYHLSAECEILCPDCVKENSEEYIDEIVNDSTKANTILSVEELEEMGWIMTGEECWSEFNNPSDVMKLKEDSARDYLFHIESVGQFNLVYRAFQKTKESD